MVLDASGNGMGGAEIEPLLDLYRLETLNLADNDVEEMAQVRAFAQESYLEPRLRRRFPTSSQLPL